MWRFPDGLGRLLPGSLLALAVSGLFKLGAIQPLENLAYTELFKLRGPIAWDDRIVLIKIDDASIQRFGRFPWSRRYYTRLFQILTPADPSVVLIDLIWSEPSPDDAKLADALEYYGRAVLPQAEDMTGLPLRPVPLLRNAALFMGHIAKPIESDGITRKVPLQIRGIPALGWAATKGYELVQGPVPRPNATSLYWVNWTGPVSQLPQYSFIDVLSGKVSPSVFRNKIVLLGVTAAAIDPLVSPFSQDGTGNGIHLHATLINSLLQNNALRPLNSAWILVILLLGGPVLGVVLSFFREEWQIIIWGVLCAGWGIWAVTALKVGFVLMPVGLPLLLFTGTAAAVAVGERLRMNGLLQNQVQQLWWQYQPDVVLPTQIEPVECPTPTPMTLNVPGTRLVFRMPSPFRVTAGAMRSMAQLGALADQFGRSQSTQSAIARSLSIGLLAAERDGRVWFCNPVIRDWLAVQVGDRLETQLVPAWLTVDQWHNALQQLHAKQVPEGMEFQRGDRWLELKLEPLNYGHNRALAIASPAARAQATQTLDGILIVLEDITLRKQVEASLERQVEELEQLSILKDEFLNTVSHDLRAPMTNIRLVLELLPGAEDEAEILQYLEILDQECTRETNLINDLLDFQRLEAKAQLRTFVSISVAEWLPPLIQPYRERAMAQQQCLRLEVDPTLTSFVSDRPSLERILTELLHNACKYTPLGGEICLAVQPSVHHLCFRVQNSGPAIPAAELSKIFDKFYRVPKSDVRQQGGTGLGLALVKKLVEHLDGEIQVQSDTKGTQFTVELPWAKADPSGDFN